MASTLPSQAQVQTAIRAFLLSILPAGQCAFTGSIAGTKLAPGQIVYGGIAPGDSVLGEFVAPGTKVVRDNGDGTFTVAPSQNSGPNPTPMSTGVEVIEYQDNRAAEPASPDFVVMSTTLRRRLATNLDSSSDAKFTGSIADDVMTISHVFSGEVEVGDVVFGVGVMAGTTVVGFLSGTGGVGTYQVAPGAQTVASTTLSAGSTEITQPTEFTVQLDVHGPNSADFAQTISTLWRDAFGVDLFANQDPNYGVTPLHADDPKQVPFVNDSQQYEWRWVVEALAQANPVVSVPQQYADVVAVKVVSVDAAFPPT